MEIILAEADDRPRFDPLFEDEMRDVFDEPGYLPEPQERALWKIAIQWKFS